MTEYEKLLKLYSKECNYAGALKYIIEDTKTKLALINFKTDPCAAAVLAESLDDRLKRLKEQYE